MLVSVFVLLANAIEAFNVQRYAAFWSDFMQLIGYASMAVGFALLVKTAAISATTTRMFRICAWIAAVNAGLHGYFLLARWWSGH